MDSENKSCVQAQRKMIHLQVSGSYSKEDLENLLKNFQDTYAQSGVIATPSNVVASVIDATPDISGLILTPKVTAIEIAEAIVKVLQAYDRGNGDKPTQDYADLDKESRVEILNRIQTVLRFGGLPAGDGGLSPRDHLFIAVVSIFANKLMMPDTSKSIRVTRVAQKEGDQNEEIFFHDLKNGDLFSYDGHMFVANDNPYVNWVADPIPVISIDAEPYVDPAPVPEHLIKQSTPSEKEVQSVPRKVRNTQRKK